MSAAQDKAKATPAAAAGDVQQPSLGRVVLVPVDPDRNNGSSEAAAVVVAVWPYEKINVRVWADNSDTPEWRTSLSQVDSPEAFTNEDGKRETHVWCWPPRV